jgi:hypothetical protein
MGGLLAFPSRLREEGMTAERHRGHASRDPSWGGLIMRIVIAGLLGGLAMYVWSSVAHVATPLGRMGISTLPNEAAITTVLKAGIGQQSGFYIFPSDMNAKAGPSGVLVYKPGLIQMSPSTLGKELVVQLIDGLIAAWLLSFAAIAGYLGRVAFVGGIGLAGALATNPSYWIWYHFPGSYTLAYMLITIVGYLVAGLVIAAILKPRTA